jgi:UDP-glucose:(heptosyl)LPS alpha-1,3-glucosyltransferase
VRRGFSSSGGAEAYLRRLAGGLAERGHQVRLYASAEWPPNEWSFGPLSRVPGRSPLAFADEMKKIAARRPREVWLSFERIWRCDVYRAGDGVHRAWLERRAEIASPLGKLFRIFNRKHAAAFALEKSLFAEGGAARVIANSEMVKAEIVRFYGFPAEKIQVIYNGVPAAPPLNESSRLRKRAALGLASDEVAVLFAGSGWERKGLRFAIKAIEACGKKSRLFVAGRGDARKFRSARVQFLGVVEEMRPLYGAADIFLLPTIYDPFSNACLEALAAGLPVVTARANGFSEIIENGVHGSIIDDPRNTDALRDALLFWSDRARREQARASILERAAHFDLSLNVERTLQVLLQGAASAAST